MTNFYLGRNPYCKLLQHVLCSSVFVVVSEALVISSVSYGAVVDPPMTSIAIFRSDRVTNNFAGFPTSMNCQNLLNRKIMWCRHREFKHDVRERRLPCHSLMNIAASSFWPVSSNKIVQIRSLCLQV